LNVAEKFTFAFLSSLDEYPIHINTTLYKRK